MVFSQEHLIETLINFYNGTSTLQMIENWTRYLVVDEGQRVCAIKLLDMLLDGRIAECAINNLDEILQCSNAV